MVPYGSTVNGLCGKGSSDLDIAFFPSSQQISARICLQTIKDALDVERYTKVNLIEQKNAINLSFTDQVTKIEIDILVNKSVELFNSALIAAYSKLDIRFHAAAFILKQWNKHNFPDNMSRVNSYSITLMLIYYLQRKNVLPVL